MAKRTDPESASIAELQRSTGASPSRYTNSGSLRALSVRLDEATYGSLATASAVLGVSANSLVNEAVQSYLAPSPAFEARKAAVARQTEAERDRLDRQAEAIRKLSGG